MPVGSGRLASTASLRDCAFPIRTLCKPRRAGELILAAHFLVQLQADTGPVIHLDEAILDNVILLLDDCRPVVPVQPVEFQHQKVWYSGADVC